MVVMTKTCGAIFLAAAIITIILSLVDTVPEVSSATAVLRQGDFALPSATSVKYRIGAEVLTDLLAVAGFALFGWFLWTSEIQQTWAVVLTFALLLGSVIIRVAPVMPMNVGRASPGVLFWGALVVDDYYPSPLVPGRRVRTALTFPTNQNNRLAVTESGLSGSEPHAAESVVLDFSEAPNLLRQFYTQGSAKIIGKLAGTRTILDWDLDKVVYSVPHLMVEEVQPIAATPPG